MEHTAASATNTESPETQFSPSLGQPSGRTEATERIKFDGTDYPSWLGFDPYKGPEESFAFPIPTTEGDPWEHTSNLVQKHDDNMCDAWVDEIQYILIFAGLFSAVVTAFAVETQKLLQTDPAAASVLLLSQLANHLAANSTPVFATLPSFEDTSTSVQSLRINIFIFISLTLSLGTALVGILVLQWIRTYRKMDPLSHQDQLCVRQSRYDGLVKWKVPALISFLPIFLQLSLVVFFAGLVDFLHTLNEKVAITIGICIGIILLGVAFTTMLPGLYIVFSYTRGKPSPIPPYQSPQAWLFYRSLAFFVASILKKKHQQWHSWYGHPSWTQLSKAYDNSLHHWLKPALLWVFRHLSDEDSFSMAYQCFKSLADKEMAQSLVLDHLAPSHLRRLYTRLKSSCPLAAEYFPSILLLHWDKYRRPLHQKVHLHVMELALRCIDLDDPHKTLSTPVDPNWLLDLMYPLLIPRAGNAPQLVAEAKTCVFLTLTLMNQEKVSDGVSSQSSKSYRWYIFWTCIIRLQANSCFDVVNDALQVLTDGISSTPQDDEGHHSSLAKCCEGLFGSLTDKQEESPVLESLFHQPAFLGFLDCFCRQSSFWHGIWKDALRYAHEQKRERWDRLLFEFRLEEKYWLLAYDPTYLQQPHPQSSDFPQNLPRHYQRSYRSRSQPMRQRRPTLADTARLLLPLNLQRRAQPNANSSTKSEFTSQTQISAIPFQGVVTSSSHTIHSPETMAHEKSHHDLQPDHRIHPQNADPEMITIVVEHPVVFMQRPPDPSILSFDSSAIHSQRNSMTSFPRPGSDAGRK